MFISSSIQHLMLIERVRRKTELLTFFEGDFFRFHNVKKPFVRCVGQGQPSTD